MALVRLLVLARGARPWREPQTARARRKRETYVAPGGWWFRGENKSQTRIDSSKQGYIYIYSNSY